MGELGEASLTVGWEQGKKSLLVGFQDVRSCEEPAVSLVAWVKLVVWSALSAEDRWT